MEKKKVLLAIKGLFSAAFVTSAGYKINRVIGKRQSAKVADSVDSSYENSIGFNDVRSRRKIFLVKLGYYFGAVEIPKLRQLARTESARLKERSRSAVEEKSSFS